MASRRLEEQLDVHLLGRGRRARLEGAFRRVVRHWMGSRRRRCSARARAVPERARRAGADDRGGRRRRMSVIAVLQRRGAGTSMTAGGSSRDNVAPPPSAPSGGSRAASSRDRQRARPSRSDRPAPRGRRLARLRSHPVRCFMAMDTADKLRDPRRRGPSTTPPAPRAAPSAPTGVERAWGTRRGWASATATRRTAGASLLKILLTNRASTTAATGVNRVSNDVPRAGFTVEEVVRLTIEFYRRNYIEGLFLLRVAWRLTDAARPRSSAADRALLSVGSSGSRLLRGVVGASEEALTKAGRVRGSGLRERRGTARAGRARSPRRRSVDRLRGVGHGLVGGDRRGHSGAGCRRASTPGGPRSRDAVGGVAPAGQSTQLIVGATRMGPFDRSSRRPIRSDEIASLWRAHTAYSPIPRAHQDPPRCIVRSSASTGSTRWTGCCASTAPHREVVTRGDATSSPRAVDPKMARALAHRDFSSTSSAPPARRRACRAWGHGAGRGASSARGSSPPPVCGGPPAAERPSSACPRRRLRGLRGEGGRPATSTRGPAEKTSTKDRRCASRRDGSAKSGQRV